MTKRYIGQNGVTVDYVTARIDDEGALHYKGDVYRKEVPCTMEPGIPVPGFPARDGEKVLACSNCGCPHYVYDTDPIYYCVECGAKVVSRG